MNHRQILTRAASLVWHSRMLWVFGFLFALAGGGGGLNFSSGGNNFSTGNSNGRPGSFPTFTLPQIDWTLVMWIAGGIILLLLLLAVVGTVIRYVAETALLTGADEIESTGAALTVRRGFRLGWSRPAWRLFLADLAIHLPLVLVFLVLVVTAATPLLLLLTRQAPLSILGGVATAALELLVILGLIAVNLALSVILPYLRRRVVLGQQGVRSALRQSARLVRASLMDTGLLWLLLAGVRIVWSLVTIPVMLVVFVLALLVGGVPALVAYLVSQSWVWPVVVGAPLFLLVLIPLASLVVGVFEAYVSTAWTLGYRDVMSRLGGQLA